MTPEQREFLESHRLCVLAIEREAGPPALSPVYYVMDDDDFLISTTATRYKGKGIKKHPNVSLSVLHEEFPFPYLMVYGTARVETDDPAGLMARIGEKMFGAPVAADAMPALEKRAMDEKRVVLRITPTGFSSRP